MNNTSGIRIKPKSYGPTTVSSSATQSIECATEAGHKVAVGPAPASNASSPSDLLLAALGTCLSLSLEMAAATLKLSVTDITVIVNATKAGDLPHRIGQFHVLISFTAALDNSDVDRLLKKTKELCTISNTLAADIQLEYRPPEPV